MQLVTGVVLHTHPDTGEGLARTAIGYSGPIDKEYFGPLPKIALAAAVGGLLLSLALGRTAMLPAICGAVVFLALLIFRSRVMAEAVEEGAQNMIGFAGGFWLVTFLFAGAALYNGWRYIKKRRRPESRPGQPIQPAGVQS